MRNCKSLIALFFLFPVSVFSQDITGLWKGTLYNDTTKQFYKYEVGISKEKDRYTGFSHTWFILGDKQYFGVKKVSIKKAPDGKFLIEDNGLISNNYPVSPSKNVRQLNVLKLNAADSIMTLEGPFTTNRTKEYHSLTGKIKLERKNDFWQSALVPHLQELGMENKLSFVKEENDLLAFVEAKQEEAVFQQLEKQYQQQVKNEEKQTDQTQKQPAPKQEIAKLQQVEKIAEEKQASEKRPAKQETAKVKQANEQSAEKRNSGKDIVKQEAVTKRLAEKENLETQSEKKQIVTAVPEKKVVEKDLAKQTTPPVIKKPVAAVMPVNITPAANVSQRKTILQQTVNFTSDSLLLTLYDNGEVDGDTVSVLMNGQLIIAKQGLSTTASKKTIYIPSTTDRVELVMYAESLGSIPPNTGLLVIRDGKDLYEIRFSGDLQKNASIVFNRKKE